MTQTQVLELFSQYHADVFRLAYSYTGSREDAQDITQETFLRLIDRQTQLREGKEKAWLLQVAANQCRNLLRRRKHTVQLCLETAAELPSVSEPQAALLQALMSLSPKERLVVHLHYYEGYKLEELAAMLRLPLSTVSMRLHRARKHLKEQCLEESL